MKKMPVIIFIQKTNDLYHPYLIGNDTTPPDNRPPLYVRGEAGQLLYMALSGHRFGSSPDDAHQLIATQARACIQAYNNKSFNEQIDYVRAMPNGSIFGAAYDVIKVEQQFVLAGQVIQHWGQFIRPWLGYYYTDDAGNVLTHHQDYEKVIMLPTPAEWGEFNLMMS